jgi:hypothetical protein
MGRMNKRLATFLVSTTVAVLAGCGSAGESAERLPARSDNADYRSAAAEVVRANQTIEQLQRALAVAEGNGATPADVAALRREVALAERRHVHAITALSDTAR